MLSGFGSAAAGSQRRLADRRLEVAALGVGGSLPPAILSLPSDTAEVGVPYSYDEDGLPSARGGAGISWQLGKLVGAPYVPITPFFPMFGLAGMIPLPTKWAIAFGKRIYLYRESRFRGPGCTDFDAMSDRLRRTVQILVNRHLGRRSSIFLG